MNTYRELFGNGKTFIAVVHLPALPGAPLHSGGMEHVIAAALQDAKALLDGGAHALIVENFGDIPFYPDRVPPETVAAMAVVTREIVRISDRPVGVNVLRNDAQAAMAVAHAAGARFIRVNVHTGAAVTDQGLVQGRAFETLRMRARLGAQVLILADVAVKHAAPLASPGLAEEARDAAARGMADALIVSGSGTGAATDPEDIRKVRDAAGIPVLVGSGTTIESLDALGAHADGFIVGSTLKKEGRATEAVDLLRTRAFSEAFRSRFG